MKLLSKLTGKAAIYAAKVSAGLVKNGPTITFVVGLTAVVGGTVSAIVATSKADAALDEFHENMELIKQNIEAANATENPEEVYPLAEQKKHTTIIYAALIKKIARIYFLTVVLEGVGIACLCKSHFTLTKRNASLAAAYAALAKSYSDYRRRVREQFGEQVENDIYNGYITTTYTEKVTSENGVTTEVEKEKQSYSPLSPHAFLISLDDNPWNMRDPYSILTQIDIVNSTLYDRLQNRRMLGRKSSMLMENEFREAFGQQFSTASATFYIPYDKNDVSGRLDIGIDGSRANIEGSTEWKFVNKIIDGIWITPPSNLRNICDDQDIMSGTRAIKEMDAHVKLEG